MIEELTVRGLKGSIRLALPLRPLTVLTGPNGTGRSTVVRSLLPARQAADSSLTGARGAAPPRSPP